MSRRSLLLSTTTLSGVVGAVFLTTISAGATDLFYRNPLSDQDKLPRGPAVDGVNWKGELLGGSIAHKSIVGTRNALSFPIDAQHGLQIDLQGGNLDGDGFFGVAAHWFWRDPGYGLLGLYAGHTHWARFGGVGATHVGVEAERYWGRFTVTAIAGIETGNSAFSGVSSTASFTTATTFVEGYDVKTRFFDQINLKYYVTDNIAAYVGHRYLGGKNALAVGSEWAIPIEHRMLASAFVEARAGSGDFQGVWGGVKLYRGQRDKSLIQRHRQDDPGFLDTLFTIVNSYTSTATSKFCALGFKEDGSCEAPFGPD